MSDVWDRVAELVYPKGQQYIDDPVLWAKDRLDVTLWAKQREILESVRNNSHTAVSSCHGIGKSFTAALTCCWWIDSHPPGTAFVVTTAPSGQQVKAILWREINRMHQRGGFEGRTNLTEWYIGKEIVAFGRKPSEYSPDAFQGIHAIYVLVVLDEACGIPGTLWDAASTLTTNEYSRSLAIGNPDDPHSRFELVCRPDSVWHHIQISAFDSPNFTGEDVPDIIKRQLTSPGWAEQKKREWGEDSALYISKVLGQFPKDTTDGVIPGSWAAKCRYLDLPAEGAKEMGFDVGAGGDRSVMVVRHGPRIIDMFTSRHTDPMKLAGEAVHVIERHGVTKVKIDSNGIGWGVMGRLKELSRVHNYDAKVAIHGAQIEGINVAEASSNPERFLNKRSELWWDVGRERSRQETWDLSYLDDEAIAELTSPKYEIMDSKGKIKIESKKKVRERMGRSPDIADAVLLAFVEIDWEIHTDATELANTRLSLGTSLQR